MRYLLFLLLFVICSAAVSVAAQEKGAPSEENCRRALEAGLEQLRRTPPDLKQHDDADRRKLLAEMEQLVETSRRAGVSECRIWTLVLGKAFNQ